MVASIIMIAKIRGSLRAPLHYFDPYSINKKIYESTCYMRLRGPDEYPLIMVGENTQGVTKGP